MKPYINEYNTEESIKRYTKETAGEGINHLLQYVYGPIYLENVRIILKQGIGTKGFRLLEFGCGCGMNLIYLLNLLKSKGIQMEAAYGTDFSERMIHTARIEAKKHLDHFENKKLKFLIASNETLNNDLSRALKTPKEELNNTFHLILGINTFRYCHRIDRAEECVRNILELLVEGGRCIVIDMNSKFPYFLSNVRPILRGFKCSNESKKISFYIRKILKADNNLPTLEEYAQPFKKLNFEILRQQNFCWIPHSARKIRYRLSRLISPVLDSIIPDYAMRSLVIAKK